METFSGTGRPGDEEVLRLSDELQRGNRYIQTVDCRTFIADTGIKNKKSQS